MGLLYKSVVRPLLFKQDPERSHEMSVAAMAAIGKFKPIVRMMERYNSVRMRPIELFGLRFPNPVGIAAGFDKNAECFTATGAFGCGHMELGTVTYHRQPGNPKPRLFRFPEQEAVINRMGFNSEGAEAIAARLAKIYVPVEDRSYVLGINIGKSKATPLENALEDYVSSFNALADYADYFTINVSSPNTQGLRSLQSPEYLPSLLSGLNQANDDRAKKLGTKRVPMLLKISPDLGFADIDFILENLLEHQFDGIIATNTTLDRPDSLKDEDCAGGLSGRPLLDKSVKVIRYISLATEGKLPIIASGGIMDPISAGAALDVGASMVQVYTGLVYDGPFLGRKIARALAWRYRDWV